MDFGTTSPGSFSAAIAAGLDGGMLEAHIDSLGGTNLATINVPRTGGWDKGKTLTEKVAVQVTGIHDLYFAFKGQNITAGLVLFNFD